MFTVAALLDTYLIEISVGLGTALHCSLPACLKAAIDLQSTDSCSTAVVTLVRSTARLLEKPRCALPD